MTLILPKGLDLKAIEQQYPPQFKAYKTDKLAYILHTLATIPVYNKNTELFEGYVPLSSKILEYWVDNYKQHIDYAIERGIIAVHPDESYSQGNYCKHYQFTEAYRTLGATYELTDVCLKRKLNEYFRARKKENKNYNHLNKWFTNKLTIDYDLVQDFLEEEWSYKNNHEVLRDFSLVKKKVKSPYQQYEYAKLSAQFIYSGQFMYKVDENVQRYHSNLTNMRGILRNALKYDGQQLVSVDISNSQPFLSLLLLQTEFWEQLRIIHQKKCLKNREPHTYFHTSLDKFYINLYERLERVIKENKLEGSLIIFVQTMLTLLNTMDKEDFAVYEEKVCQGELYDYLLKRFNEERRLNYLTRDDAKIAVLQAFFSANQFLYQKDAQLKLLFKQTFEEVYAVLAEVKRGSKELLPVLLQNIESYLVIEVIARRIAKEHPKLPLFTIHDSLVTTVGNEGILQRIMTEELTRYVDHAPHLKTEYWEPENLAKHLEKLRGKLSA